MDSWLLVVGYIVFLAYTVGIMVIGAVIEKKTNCNKTVSRKIVHIVSSFVWIICQCFFGCSVHWVILNGFGALALGFVTYCGKLKVFARDDTENSVGLFYFGLSTFIVSVVCYFVEPNLYLYAGIAYFCLSLGDGFAPIVAEIFKKSNVDIRPGKTLYGTLGVYVVSFFATLIFTRAVGMNLDVPFILSVAALTCVVEFYSVKGLDNLFIEFFVFGYLVLSYYGFVDLWLQIVLIVSPILAILAIKFKAMTTSGGVSALILFVAVGFFGRGYLPSLFIFTLFAVNMLVNVVKNRLVKAERSENSEKDGRGAKQIVAVGLFGIVFLIVYYYSGVEFFYYLFFLSFVEQFADSMASDIGGMTKGKTVNIITFKSMQKGISGGVSLIGTLSALLGSLFLAVILYLFGAVSLKVYLLIALFAFAGTVIDSVAGALLQALYRCETCGRVVEKPICCAEKATLIKGFSAVDNVAVNYIANFVTCIMGGLLIVL